MDATGVRTLQTCLDGKHEEVFRCLTFKAKMWRRDVWFEKTLGKSHMGVSENSGTPKSSI